MEMKKREKIEREKFQRGQTTNFQNWFEDCKSLEHNLSRWFEHILRLWRSQSQDYGFCDIYDGYNPVKYAALSRSFFFFLLLLIFYFIFPI